MAEVQKFSCLDVNQLQQRLWVGPNRSQDMEMWPLLSLVPSELKVKISQVFAFGQYGTEILFTTLDDKVI